MNNEGGVQKLVIFITQTSQYTGPETYTGPKMSIEDEGKDYGRYF